MAFSFHDRGGAPTGNRRTAALSMVALVRLSAGCVYRPVIFSTIGHARVLKEKGNLLKETVPAPLKVEQVQTALFETNPLLGRNANLPTSGERHPKFVVRRRR